MRQFTARFATEAEIASWDDHVIASPGGGNLLQSASFASVKAKHGWKPLYLVYEGTTVLDGEEAPFASYNLVLEKSVPALGKIWYMIKGPGVNSVEEIPAILDANEDFIKREKLGVFAVKIEPDVIADDSINAFMAKTGLVKSWNIQPNDSTAILDTDKSEEDVLKSLSSRGRNAVRRSLREGCEVERVPLTEENMKKMYALMDTVGQGNANVHLRSYDYYRDFWTTFDQAGQGRLYFTYEDGEPSVGAYVIRYGEKGTYKDGGSKPRRKQYGDSHQVQWTALTDLMKEFDIKSYDFCGTPPKSELKNKDHHHYGLGLFKTSFTKDVIDYVGVWDQVLSPVKYKAWNQAVEKVMRQLWVRKTGQPFY
ncbi:peptidoglycan bridge formation glycyltransferase FemA/FemB family protein [Rothia sp. SD9660Na]|uniref:lipid II:glycine glycyltransferase FemX n=1 Tax=Rothia sp. SD9660Na TaxID=3047030 RepID=UPI0024BB3C6D|nr:peptidoglycan bridge formation glycyltransferase FemA/FemB family protein [Rothia sp. SD9660Na]WHS50727.1 peptidoglycan bridge formation glycyltransferase FemA/FemB family protein [Rothia sp. SD9660Na]